MTYIASGSSGSTFGPLHAPRSLKRKSILALGMIIKSNVRKHRMKDLQEFPVVHFVRLFRVGLFLPENGKRIQIRPSREQFWKLFACNNYLFFFPSKGWPFIKYQWSYITKIVWRGVELQTFSFECWIRSSMKSPRRSRARNITELKGQVIRDTFHCNLSRNIVALQVAKLCCPFYHPRKQLVAQQISVLHVAATCCTK